MSALRTPRLLPREWREGDLDAFAALNADPEVRSYFPNLMSREESAASLARIREHFTRHGFDFWAVELPGEAPFIGFVGLAHTLFEAPFTPAMEMGWRLARPYWGRGLATEGARATLQDGFGRFGWAETAAFTAEGNKRSRAVMERLGMARDPRDDFDHPKLPGHPLERHVLYRIARGAFLPALALLLLAGCASLPAGEKRSPAPAFHDIPVVSGASPASGTVIGQVRGYSVSDLQDQARARDGDAITTPTAVSMRGLLQSDVIRYK